MRIAIDNQQARLKAGQFVSVRLPLSRPEAASLVAPSRAGVLLEGQPYVFVLDGERVKQRRVLLGFVADQETELLSGVEEGERVVVDDPSRVSDGMAVTVRAAEALVASKPSPAQSAL